MEQIYNEKEYEWLKNNISSYGTYANLAEEFNKEFDRECSPIDLRSKAYTYGLGLGTKYTPEEDNWLRANFNNSEAYPTYSKLTNAFNKEFNRTRSAINIYKHCTAVLNLEKRGRNIYTPEQDEWLKAHIKSGDTYAQLAEKFNAEFNTSHSAASIKNRCTIRLNIRRNDTIRASAHKFTPEEDEWLKSNICNFRTYNQLAEAFNTKFNCTLSSERVYNYCRRNLGVLPGKYASFTEEQDNWLKSNINAYATYPQLTEAFNEEFNTTYSQKSIAGRCRTVFSLKKNKSDFTPERDSWLKANITAYATYQQLTEAFNKEFNIACSVGTVANHCYSALKLKKNRTDFSRKQTNWLKENITSYAGSGPLTRAFNKRFNTSLKPPTILNHCVEVPTISLTLDSFTPQEDAWLRANVWRYGLYAYLTAGLNAAFNKSHSVISVEIHCAKELEISLGRSNVNTAFTAEEDKWLKENYTACNSYNALTQMFNTKFTHQRTPGSITQRCYKLNLRIERSGVFTEAMNNWLRTHFNSNTTHTQLAQMFNTHFGTNVQLWQIGNQCRKLGLSRQLFSAHMDIWIRDNHANSKSCRHLTQMFNAHFGTAYTERQIATRSSQLGLHRQLFTDEMDDWLRANFSQDIRCKQLTQMFNTHFKASLKDTQIRYRCNRLGLWNN